MGLDSLNLGHNVNTKIQYIHVRKKEHLWLARGDVILPQGGYTIAYTMQHFLNEDVTPWWAITCGIARCSDKDNFCKKTGRDFSAERLHQRLQVYPPPVDLEMADADYKYRVEIILDHLGLTDV